MRALPGKSSRLPPESQPVTRDAAPADQRRRILGATVELMAERGFQNTTAELIIRRARVGYGTFYKHFGSKEDCLLAIFDRSAEICEARLRAAYEGQPGPWSSKVAALLATFFQQLTEHPAVARVCLVEVLTTGTAGIGRYESATRILEPFFRSGRTLTPPGRRLPEPLEGTLACGVLWMANQQVARGEIQKLESLLPETIEFVLRPYVGEEQAVQAADELPDEIAAPSI
jgi:AcrR family transcriptional regulator